MTTPQELTDRRDADAWPVERIPTDPPGDPAEPGIALCLSGGGYRAMLFHLGALWRLNEVGFLPTLDRVSSVSGGSITAGVLGLHWERLAFDGAGVGRRFDAEVVAPVRRLAGTTIDFGAVLRGVLGPGSISDRVVAAYRRHAFGDATLQALPDRPRFVINAANVQSGALWRFSKPYAWDYRVGKMPAPRTPLAVAVAASSAFPPFLSPLVLRPDRDDFEPGTGLDLQRPPFTTAVQLSDGGVYDNLGLETAWKRYRTVLVSDGGGRIEAHPGPRRDWLFGSRRVIDVIDSQVRSLRKRRLIDSYRSGLRDGAYWGAYSDIAHFGVADALPCPAAQTAVLARLPTRLAALDRTTQERLINWGYAVCDAAIRRHVDPALSPPTGFPYPRAGVG